MDDKIRKRGGPSGWFIEEIQKDGNSCLVFQ
jgi:hypothetical protein